VENKSLNELIEQVKQNSFSSSKGFDRRRFLQGAGKVAGVSLGLTIAQSIGLNAVEVSAAAPKFSSYPFTLGVASGDPSRSGASEPRRRYVPIRASSNRE